MPFMSDPFAIGILVGAILLAFLVGRFGRKLYERLRRGKPQARSGPPPSRQVRRAERRKRDKRQRD